MSYKRSPVATIVCLALALMLLSEGSVAADAIRDQQHERLGFLVGAWNTSHSIPSGDGETRVVKGKAVIEWSVGSSWLLHEFEADFPGRGQVFMTTLMNYSPPKKMYNFYMFDHFGGEAGAFYGDWNSENELILTASFTEEDGSTSYQRMTLKPISTDEIWILRAFSDDGESYHFEAKGVYTRQPER